MNRGREARLRRALLALIVAIAVVAAGCGKDETPSPAVDRGELTASVAVNVDSHMRETADLADTVLVNGGYDRLKTDPRVVRSGKAAGSCTPAQDEAWICPVLVDLDGKGTMWKLEYRVTMTGPQCWKADPQRWGAFRAGATPKMRATDGEFPVVRGCLDPAGSSRSGRPGEACGSYEAGLADAEIVAVVIAGGTRVSCTDAVAAMRTFTSSLVERSCTVNSCAGRSSPEGWDCRLTTAPDDVRAKRVASCHGRKAATIEAYGA